MPSTDLPVSALLEQASYSALPVQGSGHMQSTCLSDFASLIAYRISFLFSLACPKFPARAREIDLPELCTGTTTCKIYLLACSSYIACTRVLNEGGSLFLSSAYSVLAQVVARA